MDSQTNVPFVVCACIGRVANNPFCPCEMRRKGLVPTDIWTPIKIKELHSALSKMFNWKE